MAQSTTLKVHQVCSVSPPQETSPTSLPFTFYDVLWLRLPPVERLFFYEFLNPTISFFDSILPNLKHSLSLTLQHFFPIAGTITWPNDSPQPIINYVPGNTVPFTVAESNANFNRLCSNFCEVKERQHLIPHLTISHEQASVLAIQVTIFPKFGFCIGITTHHAALDGKSSTLFMKSWAHLCSHLKHSSQPLPSLPQDLTPSFDRSMIIDPSGIGETYLKAWLTDGGATNNRSLNVWKSLCTLQDDAVKGLFELTSSDIQKLKEHAESKVNKKVSFGPSNFAKLFWELCFVTVGCDEE
ncbi:phenolic glucoside malonyltransferase 1-like [Abrus precatorius]|uniref:Phenolic glucoside malonyltransferase 1-like n=1 Tax=Abrus precatorius TaxID=3816 RepID=A0A8B8LR14_ABRPR|nr:phenolic glucoside malonyltransferase 1-like [Abrus precatorius]